MKNAAKRFCASLFYYLGGIYLTKLLSINKKYLLVLNYHHFNEYYSKSKGSYFSCIDNDIFVRQLKFFKKYFQVINVKSFYEGGMLSNGVKIAITFDDGYYDNITHAVPALIENEIKDCTFFLTTDLVGTNRYLWHDIARVSYVHGEKDKNDIESRLAQVNRGEWFDWSYFEALENTIACKDLPRLMMSWKDASALRYHGFAVGAHTCNHTPLAFLNDEERHFQLSESISKVNRKLDVNSDCFAYPNGIYNDNTLALLPQLGIKYGFTTKPGVNTENTPLLELNRIGVNTFDSPSIVLLKIFLTLLRNR